MSRNLKLVLGTGSIVLFFVIEGMQFVTHPGYGGHTPLHGIAYLILAVLIVALRLSRFDRLPLRFRAIFGTVVAAAAAVWLLGPLSAVRKSAFLAVAALSLSAIILARLRVGETPESDGISE
jgi:hypothetical protein